MGLLDRLRGRGDDAAQGEGTASDSAGSEGATGTMEGVEPVESIGTRRLTAEEETALDEARAGYAEHGIDPAELDSIAAAYDRALARHEHEDEDEDDEEAAARAVAVLGTALGDHLVAAGGYHWVMSTDPFGTDLAVEPPRRGVPVVTRMLVAVRWLGRERDWVRGVTEHLVRLGRS